MTTTCTNPSWGTMTCTTPTCPDRCDTPVLNPITGICYCDHPHKRYNS